MGKGTGRGARGRAGGRSGGRSGGARSHAARSHGIGHSHAHRGHGIGHHHHGIGHNHHGIGHLGHHHHRHHRRPFSTMFHRRRHYGGGGGGRRYIPPDPVPTAVAALTLQGEDACFGCPGGEGGAMTAPLQAPPTFADLYSADEWTVFAAQVNRIWAQSHVPCCPCCLLFPCFVICACIKGDARAEDLTSLASRENARLAEVGLGWVLTPARTPTIMALTWLPTRPAWEAANPLRRAVSREPPLAEFQSIAAAIMAGHGVGGGAVVMNMGPGPQAQVMGMPGPGGVQMVMVQQQQPQPFAPQQPQMQMQGGAVMMAHYPPPQQQMMMQQQPQQGPYSLEQQQQMLGYPPQQQYAHPSPPPPHQQMHMQAQMEGSPQPYSQQQIYSPSQGTFASLPPAAGAGYPPQPQQQTYM